MKSFIYLDAGDRMPFESVWQTPPAGMFSFSNLCIAFVQADLEELPCFSQMVIASSLKQNWSMEWSLGQGQTSDSAALRLPTVESFPFILAPLESTVTINFPRPTKIHAMV